MGVIVCERRAYMLTSHASRPAAWKAASISRSPLDPSCRTTATRCRCRLPLLSASAEGERLLWLLLLVALAGAKSSKVRR